MTAKNPEDLAQQHVKTSGFFVFRVRVLVGKQQTKGDNVMSTRFEVKKLERWEAKPEVIKTRLNRAIFNRAMNTAKRIASERELRRLQWNI